MTYGDRTGGIWRGAAGARGRGGSPHVLAACILAFALDAVGEEPAVRPGGLLVLSGGGSMAPAVFTRIADRVGRNAEVGVVTEASEDAAGALAAARERWLEGGFTRVERHLLTRTPVPASIRVLYLGGGDQVRLLEAIEHAGARDAIEAFLARGGVLVGNSAGTAALCRRALTGRGGDDELRAGAVGTIPGVPVLAAVVDQHFVARRRFGRLLSAVLESDVRLGIGIDEATAVLVTDGTELEVQGAGTATILDARRAEVKPARPGETLAARGVTVHVLRAGDRWSLR
jgi:cyanophycinase